jgi:hypothetical protein
MQVQSESEGDDICERLRAAGIRCAVEPLPDPNANRAILGGMAPDVLTVLVEESDLDKAREVLATQGGHPPEQAP